jgi:hypothetical protein
MINMPFLGAPVHASFTRPDLAVRSVVLAALAVCIGCGESSVPSPFVADASVDALAHDSPDGKPTSADAGALDGSSGNSGEWGGPCVDETSCDDKVSCTTDSCDGELHLCHFVPDDAACDDGAYCNGAEACIPAVGCRAAEPVACSDGTPCTIDACDETTDQCTHTARDADADGDTDGNCPSGGDCNDSNPNISSLIQEVCDNGVDDNCDGKADESTCLSPKYDTCLAPLDVDAPGSFLLTTAAAHLDYSASCVAAGSRTRDLAVAVHVPAGDPVDVDLVLNGALGTSVGIAAARTCGDASSEIRCGRGVVAPDNTPVARIRLRGLEPGVFPVYVFADSTGEVTLSVDFVAAVPEPANETCGTSVPIVPGTHVEAALVDAAVDLTTACGGPFGDLFYDFVLTEARDVRVFATSKDARGIPILSLRNSNCADQEILCHQDTNDLVFYRALPPGHYYVGVGATGPSDVDVLVEVEPPSAVPADENCSGAPAIGPAVTTSVDLADHMDDVQVGCSTGMADAALALNVTALSDVLVIVGVSSGDSVALSVNEPACTVTGVLSCTSGSAGPLRTVARSLAPGDYRVVVESKKSNPVSVTTFVRPATARFLVPFSDDCVTVAEIPESGGSFQGNTSNSTDDFTASCDVGGGTPAPDQLLHLKLQKQRRVVFDTRGSDYATIVDVRSGATCPGEEMTGGCSAGYSTGRSFVDKTLPAGDYWVQLDGYDSSSGQWVLDVFTSD